MAALFAALVVVWLRPLYGQLGAAIPGAGPGDNVVFVWNVWWTRYALMHGLDPLSSSFLLYPFGADLTLHTHTFLPALAVSFIANPVLAQNTLIFAHLFLNFVCAYALALRETRHRGAAVLAGLVFGWSPYISAHLNGHFNLIAAWVLPLAALVTLWANDRPGVWRGVVVGVVLGGVAHVDYYYFIYASLLALLLTIHPLLSLHGGSDVRPRVARVAASILLVLAGIGLCAALLVAVTGGGVWRVGGVALSMLSAWNPLALMWLCALAWLFLRYAIRWRVALNLPAAPGLRLMAIGGFVGIAVAVAAHAARAVRLAASGAYVSQAYYWRSAPPGVDLLTIVGGNPYSLLYGHWVRRFYDAAGVNTIEQVAWFGPALIVLLAFGLGARKREPWLLALIVFSVWALGPFIDVAGRGTPFWLPAVIVRWLPVVANARIPARAIVVVYLAGAMLAAFGVRRLLADGRRTLAAALAGLLVLDLAAAPPPVVALGRPAVLDALLSDPAPGAVLEVPMGLRDGFGETGTLDPNAMWLQTIHERPIAGGFVARLPQDAAARYLQHPTLAPFLDPASRLVILSIEMPGSAPDTRPGPALWALGFRYVLVNRALASEAALAQVRRLEPVTLVAEDPGYILYRLTR